MPISSALGSSALLPAGLGFRNKVINGDMRIAQRGTGAITASSVNQYPVDRWIATSNATNPITFQQVADGPAGFTNSVRATSGGTGSAYSSNHYTFLTQRFEGFNVADLAWGTASAKPIVLSFWVKVSANAMGTHSLVVENSTGAMTYIATYTVSTTNWEYKTIQINGPTNGSFPTDNSTGFQIDFTLGVGSAFEGTAGTWTSGKYATAGSVDLGSLSSATWQITGVQLEQNTQPTPFEQRPYGIELQLCQRYYEKSFVGTAPASSGLTSFAGSVSGSNGLWIAGVQFKVTKRDTPNITTYDNNNNAGKITTWSGGISTDNISAQTNWRCNAEGFACYYASGVNGIWFGWVAEKEL